MGNKKGILTRQRQPKAAAHVLRQRYLNITLDPSGLREPGDQDVLHFESRFAGLHRDVKFRDIDWTCFSDQISQQIEKQSKNKTKA